MARTFRNFAHVAGPLLLSLLPFAAATVAHPAAAAVACAERTTLLAQLERKFAERPQAIGLSADGGMLEILASASGSWTILITYPKRPTCVIATGEAFENIRLVIAGQPA